MNFLQDRISYLLLRAGRALYNRRSEGLGAVGLHCGQDLVLLELCRQEGVRQAELAARLGVEPPTVTKMLTRMESAGVVRRAADPEDRRAVAVSPTEKGRRLKEDVEQCWHDVEACAVSGLSRSETAELERLLTKLVLNLEDRPPTTDRRPPQD